MCQNVWVWVWAWALMSESMLQPILSPILYVTHFRWSQPTFFLVTMQQYNNKALILRAKGSCLLNIWEYDKMYTKTSAVVLITQPTRDCSIYDVYLGCSKDIYSSKFWVICIVDWVQLVLVTVRTYEWTSEYVNKYLFILLLGERVRRRTERRRSGKPS